MANNENLKKGTATRFKKGTDAENFGRKGGKASGESRRKKKAMKEALTELLSMPIKDGALCDIEQINSLEALKGANITAQEKILLEVIFKALNGDVRAAEFIRDATGQKPKAQMKIERGIPVLDITTEDIKNMLKEGSVENGKTEKNDSGETIGKRIKKTV